MHMHKHMHMHMCMSRRTRCGCRCPTDIYEYLSRLEDTVGHSLPLCYVAMVEATCQPSLEAEGQDALPPLGDIGQPFHWAARLRPMHGFPGMWVAPGQPAPGELRDIGASEPTVRRFADSGSVRLEIGSRWERPVRRHGTSFMCSPDIVPRIGGSSLPLWDPSHTLSTWSGGRRCRRGTCSRLSATTTLCSSTPSKKRRTLRSTRASTPSCAPARRSTSTGVCPHTTIALWRAPGQRSLPCPRGRFEHLPVRFRMSKLRPALPSLPLSALMQLPSLSAEPSLAGAAESALTGARTA